MSKAFESIKKGLHEAIDFSQGKVRGARVFQPFEVDVKKLRQGIGMTQEEFAAAFGISINTLRHWERGDRTPQGPALVLLNLVHKDPKAILNIIHR